MPSKTEDKLIPKLNASLQKVIDQQIAENEPPEVNQTIKRLAEQGFPIEEIRQMLAKLVAKHFHLLLLEKKFNSQLYKEDLLKLPDFEKPV